MQKALKIDEATAKKHYANASSEMKAIFEETFGKKTFLTKVTDRINTMEDVYEALGMDSDDVEQFEEFLETLDDDTACYEKLKKLALALNEGWKPNWDDSNEYKWFPYFDMRSSSGFGFSRTYYDCTLARTGVGSRLCFKTEALAQHAGKKFTNLYKGLLTI